jgi:hypothetical protein
VKQAFSALESLITIALAIAGIVGLSYKIFRDGGWFTSGFNQVVDMYIHRPLIGLGLTVALFFSYRAWQRSTESGRGGKFFDLILYALMAAGAYFIAHYFFVDFIEYL